MAICGKQHDVYPQPTGLGFLSRFIDRVSSLRSAKVRENSARAVSSPLWLLSGLVSLRCHRGSATARSIILCIYLGALSSWL